MNPRTLRRLQLLLVSFPISAHADYVFTNVSLPGSVTSAIYGINDNGQVTVSGDNGGSFIYSNGTFTSIPSAPGWDYTLASGINNAGVVVGLVGTATNSLSQGFILNAGSFSFVSYPGASQTDLRTIGNGGLITGTAITGTQTIGFLYNPTTQAFVVPFPNYETTIIGGVNSVGQSVGTTYLASGITYSFLRQPDGAITTIGSPAFRTRGINDEGVISGFQFVGGVEQSFVGTSAGFQTVNVPSSITGLATSVSTVTESINNAGQIAGYWYESNESNLTHGFIASPASLPVGTTSEGGYIFNTAVIPNVPIFIDPAFATGYDYSIGVGDPLFASVTLPIGIGDNLYTIVVDGASYAVAGGTEFDFTANGFADGVDAFRVLGIEADAALDPSNSSAFVTELTFVSGGLFTGTQTPIVAATVDEPTTSTLLGLASLAMLAAAKIGAPRRRREFFGASLIAARSA